jgi:hypothetical protein
MLAVGMRRCIPQWFLIWIGLGLREMDKDEEGGDGRAFPFVELPAIVPKPGERQISVLA